MIDIAPETFIFVIIDESYDEVSHTLYSNMQDFHEYYSDRKRAMSIAQEYFCYNSELLEVITSPSADAIQSVTSGSWDYVIDMSEGDNANYKKLLEWAKNKNMKLVLEMLYMKD